MSDVIRDIRDAMVSEIQAELGSTYKPLAYLEDVAKNSFRTSSERFGVRPLASSQVPGVTKYYQFIQSFEIVISKQYLESSIDDSEKVEKSLDNREIVLALFKRMINNKAGLPSMVLNVFDLAIAEPEYLEQDKVAVQRATMNIQYRLTLL
jgi:hypothetical protein